MTLDFREVDIAFDPTTGQEQLEPGQANFNSTVRRAEAAIKSFNLRFNNGDHHLLREQIQIENIRPEGNNVRFNVRYVLRDNSGNFDDPYSGTVSVLVIADVQ